MIKMDFGQCATCRDGATCCYSRNPDTDDYVRVKTYSADNKERLPAFNEEDREPKTGLIPCVELVDGSGCKLGKDKPTVCETYPLFPIFIGDKFKIGVSTRCPIGIGVLLKYAEGDTLPPETIEDFKSRLKLLEPDEIYDWSSRVSKFDSIGFINN